MPVSHREAFLTHFCRQVNGSLTATSIDSGEGGAYPGVRWEWCPRGSQAGAPLHRPRTGEPPRQEMLMQPQRYGPFHYVPINRRPRIAWPHGARVALWVIPNVETFPLNEP